MKSRSKKPQITVEKGLAKGLAKGFALATALTILLSPLASPSAAWTPKFRNNKQQQLIAEDSKSEDAAKKNADKPEKKKEEEKTATGKKDSPQKKEPVSKQDKGTAAGEKAEREKAKKEADKTKKAEEKARKEAEKKSAAESKAKADKEAATDNQNKANAEKEAAVEIKNKAKAEKEAAAEIKNKAKADIEAKKKAEKQRAQDEKKVAKEKKRKGLFSKESDEEEAEVPKGNAQPTGKSPAQSTAIDQPPPAGSKVTYQNSGAPVLLPDTALVSVLQDISKTLIEADDDKGVETDDDKLIVGLAKGILDKALGAGGLRVNRILEKGKQNDEKSSMTTEAWASGDVRVSDNLRGSVATVWAKRINGLVNVTIAGECKDKTLSNGKTVGEFIVVVKGRSPVKSGFDIQSQSDVTYWIGSVAAISVDAAGSSHKENDDDDESHDKSSAGEQQTDKNSDVKKKSAVILESVITRRGLEYIAALAVYQAQQEREMLAKYRAEAALNGLKQSTANDTSSESDKSRIAVQPGGGAEVQRGSRQGVAGDEVGAREVDGERDIEDGDDGEHETRREPPAQGDEATALRDALGPEETSPAEVSRDSSANETAATSGTDKTTQPYTVFEERLKTAESAKVHDPTTVASVKTNELNSTQSGDSHNPTTIASVTANDPKSTASANDHNQTKAASVRTNEPQSTSSANDNNQTKAASGRTNEPQSTSSANDHNQTTVASGRTNEPQSTELASDLNQTTVASARTNEPQSTEATKGHESTATESARSSEPPTKADRATDAAGIRPEMFTSATSSRKQAIEVVSKGTPSGRIEETDDKWLANDPKNAEDFSLRNKFKEAIEKRAKKLSGNQTKPDNKQVEKAYSTEGSRISIADEADEPQYDDSGSVRTTVATEPQPSAPSWRDDWSRDGGTSGSTQTDRPQDSTGAHLVTNATSPAAIDSSPSTTPPASPRELFTPAQPARAKTLDSDRIAMSQPGTTLSPAPASASSRTWESPAINSAPRSPSLSANVLVPDRAIAGKYLTVSVLANDKQPEHSVELSINGATVSTDTGGQALYLIPDDMNPGRTLHISLTERPELSPVVVDILQPLDDTTGQKPPRIDKMSPLIANGGILVIDGHDFDGLAEKNRILIDGELESKVLAASPVQLRVLMPPKLVPGTHSVTINSNSLKSNSVNFDFVKAEVVQPDLKKTKGALTRIVVKVQGTKQPVAIRIVNRTPDIIKMTKGDNTIATTNGGADNYYAIPVKQLKKGDIRIDASVEP